MDETLVDYAILSIFVGKNENNRMDLTISNDGGIFLGNLQPCDAFDFKAWHKSKEKRFMLKSKFCVQIVSLHMV